MPTVDGHTGGRFLTLWPERRPASGGVASKPASMLRFGRFLNVSWGASWPHSGAMCQLGAAEAHRPRHGMGLQSEYWVWVFGYLWVWSWMLGLGPGLGVAGVGVGPRGSGSVWLGLGLGGSLGIGLGRALVRV